MPSKSFRSPNSRPSFEEIKKKGIEKFAELDLQFSTTKNNKLNDDLLFRDLKLFLSL
jgi:hypothetical protein